MDHEIVTAAKEKMQKTLSVLKKELGSLRAGRANAQILDRIMVDYYGTPTPLQQLGNISIPEPRLLVISVWDTKCLQDVEKAIQKSDIGVYPTNDGKVIRLAFPELTEERRKELVKTVHKRGEEAKVAVRAIRRDANEQLKKLEKSSEITEDDLKNYEHDTQKATDDAIKDLEKILADKEKEIMEV